VQIGKITLRPEYQVPAFNRCIEHIRESWKENKFDPVFVNAYVAAGKTVIIGAVAAYASAKNKKVLILARQTELVDQCAEMLWLMECRNSMFSSGMKEIVFNVACSTEGTCSNNLDGVFSEFIPDIILIDECHMVNWREVIESGSSQYSKIINHFKALNPNLALVGFTGSPYRGIESIKGPFWSGSLIDIDREYLVNNGFIVPTIFGVPDVEYDFHEFDNIEREGTKDFSAKQLEEMAHKAEDSCLTTQVVNDFVTHTKDRLSTLVTCASEKHCLQVGEKIGEIGETWAIITGKTPDKERGELLAKAKSGEIKYMLQIGCLTTGVNVPIWANSVILRRIGSLTLFTQLLGRGMRLSNGDFEKSDHLVLDYSGTMDVMGEMFADPLLEEAQLEKAKRKSELIKCPQCGTENSMYAKRCIGYDQNSKDERCEFFFVEPIQCLKCGTNNSPNARDCRGCGEQLKDPNEKLSGKHYTANDFIKVIKMEIKPSRNNGLIVNFYLQPDKDKGQELTKVNLFFMPFGSDGAKRIWKQQFLNRFCPKGFHGHVAKMRNGAEIARGSAMFDTPTHITARKNDKDYWNVHGVQFKTKRLMGNKETGVIEL